VNGSEDALVVRLRDHLSVPGLMLKPMESNEASSEAL
jgi:hypothetical protein